MGSDIPKARRRPPVDTPARRSNLMMRRLRALAERPGDPLYASSESLDLSSATQDPKGTELQEMRSALFQILGFADAAAIQAGWKNGLIGTRAFHLVLALDRELKALENGAKSPALVPRSPTSAKQTKSLHDTISRMKDETAAAAEMMFRWGAPREQVWEGIALVVYQAGYRDWGRSSIKQRHAQLMRSGRLDQGVSALLLAILQGGRTEEAPVDWTPVVGPNHWDSATAIRHIEARLRYMAQRAAAILEATERLRDPKT